MGILLQNNSIRLSIDLPEEKYRECRFDWSGKIIQATFKGIPLLGRELPNQHSHQHGRGLYNEFGFKLPLGFEEVEVGDWFHKIGVGLLKKDSPTHDFAGSYEIRPALFEYDEQIDQLTIYCKSELYAGYAYELHKKFKLTDSGWVINYELLNTGEKTIVTNEYTHNFLALANASLDQDSQLTFPFDVQPDQFEETINPEGFVDMGQSDVHFKGQPSRPFFFSYLSGNDEVEAYWKLTNKKSGLSISETGDFKTRKVFLWGSGHVISPELFIEIELPAGQSMAWKREYSVASQS